MKKLGITLVFIIIFIIAVFTGIYIYNSKNKTNNEKVENTINTNKIVSNQIDYSVKNDITIKTNTNEEKMSPKATVTFKTKYIQCGHILKQYKQIPEELVNLTKDEIEEKYEDWEIESFASLSLILIKEEAGYCNEHYILKQKGDMIAIYKLKENGEETLQEETGISIEYLTENDKMKIEKGITVYGKEELNSILEDYE